MRIATDVYFGWGQPGHMQGCARPAWEVDTRVEYHVWRGSHGGGDHSCPSEDCGHRNRYDALTVRVICRSCGVIHLHRGELMATETTTTRSIGYGQPPRKVAGLWLYPGAPLLLADPEPYEYLCTIDRVDRLEPDHVVGYIAQGRGKRGGVTWAAAALPEIDHDNSLRRPRLRYTVTSGETTFKTATAAAKWLRDRIADGAPARQDAAQ